MAQPTPYNRQYNFQNYQAANPTAPLPGDELDNELNAVKLTVDQTLVNLAKIQRDDGALKNGSVGQDQLSPSLSIGFTFLGSWTVGVNYSISDGVSVGSTFYKAKLSHLSAVANQPPNATYWDEVADFTPLAIGVDSVSTAAIQNLAVTTAKLADLSVTTGKLADLSVTTGKVPDKAITLAKVADIATSRVLGRVTAGSGVIEELSVAQLQTLIGGGLPTGYISGLTLSNNATDATNDIDIAAGKARNSTDTADMVLASALTKRLDASWAVGTNQGGLDTGSIANAWYHVHLIKRVDTGVVDVLFSLSATAPTLPTNYTVFRRIGAIWRTSGAIRAFSQVGNQFLWKTARRDHTGVTPSNLPGTLYIISVPPSVQVEAICSAIYIGSASSYNILRSPDATQAAASASDFDCFTSSTITFASIQVLARTDTSAQLFASTSSSLTTMDIVTKGWNDPL